MTLRKTRVRLLDVPVALFCSAEQHANDLLREVALMAAAHADADHGRLFAAMLAEADRYAHRPAVRQHLINAVDVAQQSGCDHVTVEFDADPAIADAALAWEKLLQRFDALSRQERILSLPATADITAYRAWFVSEVVEQVETGREPVSWTAAAGRDLAGAR